MIVEVKFFYTGYFFRVVKIHLFTVNKLYLETIVIFEDLCKKFFSQIGKAGIDS